MLIYHQFALPTTSDQYGKKNVHSHLSVLWPPLPPLQPIVFPGDKEIVQVSHHPEGQHFLALTHAQEVFAWGTGTDGQLGLGDKR